MNQMELSPNYAGTLRGFSNTFSNITGFVAPLVAGAIISNNVSKRICLFSLHISIKYIFGNNRHRHYYSIQKS